MAKEAERASSKGSVPFWLLVLGLAVMLFAFSRGETTHDASFEGISFDLAGASASADPGEDGYSAARKSNHAFAMVRVDARRFYALYGPTPAQLGGVLVGDGDESGGVFSSANLHEFSVESGGLRVSAQEGRFVPARFVEGETVRADDAAPRHRVESLAGRYAGKLSDATGSWPATLVVDAAGRVAIDSETCHARGNLGGDSAAPAWAVSATFEAGCAQHGATLHGHAVRRGDSLVLVMPSADLNRGAVFSGSPRPAGPRTRG